MFCSTLAILWPLKREGGDEKEKGKGKMKTEREGKWKGKETGCKVIHLQYLAFIYEVYGTLNIALMVSLSRVRYFTIDFLTAYCA